MAIVLGLRLLHQVVHCLLGDFRLLHYRFRQVPVSSSMEFLVLSFLIRRRLRLRQVVPVLLVVLLSLLVVLLGLLVVSCEVSSTASAPSSTDLA